LNSKFFNNYRGQIYIALGTFFVGGVSVFSKLALESLTPIWFLVWLYLISTILCFPFGKKIVLPKDARYKRFFVLHIFGMMFGWYLSVVGLQYLDAPSAAFLSRVEFPIIMAISFFFLKEKLSKGIFVSIILSSVGVALMAEQGMLNDLLSFQKGKNWGIFLVMLASLGFALGELGTKIIAGKMNSRVFAFLRNLIMLAIVTCAALLMEGFRAPTAMGLLYAGLAGISGPVLARILYMEALKRIKLGEASVYTQMEPVAALLFALFLGMELPEKNEYLGGGLILLSCLFLLWFQGRQKRLTSLSR
jgi:O-acetylserine/cysteine efflux transporter